MNTDTPTLISDHFNEWNFQLDDLNSTIDTALQILENQQNHDDENNGYSLATKRRKISKLIKSLHKSKSQISNISQGLQNHINNNFSEQERYLQAEQGRLNAIKQLEEAALDLQDALQRLRTSESLRQEAENEREKAEGIRMQAVEQYDVLKNEAEKCKEMAENAQFELAEVETKLNACNQEKLRLLKQAQEDGLTTSNLQNLSNKLKEQLNKSEQQLETQRDMTAKLTADNLVFIMKLRTQEDELTIIRQERDKLREAVEQQKGAWFEQIRQEVQTKLKVFMQQSIDLQSELDTIEQRHQTKINQINSEKQNLQDELNKSQQKINSCTTQIHDLEEQIKLMEDRMHKLQSNFEQSDRQYRDAISQNRALQNELEQLRNQHENRYMEIQQGIKKQEELLQQLEQKNSEFDQFQESFLRLQDDLRVQKEVNKQVMKRKEEMEWELMKALTPNFKSNLCEVDEFEVKSVQNDENLDPEQFIHKKLT